MPADTAELRRLYRQRARHYDHVTWVYRRFGFRDKRYRARAIERLALKPGATVLDLACGTGLGFAGLVEKVGPEGSVVGVDVTDAMLERARRRVRRAGWTNVQLVEADLAQWTFPAADAMVSSLAFHLIPEYERVIEGAAAALKPGGRFALLDLKLPEAWPEWSVRLGAWLNRGYGVSPALAERTPWDAVRRHLRETHYEEFFGGALYLLVAEKTRAAGPR